VSTIEKVLVEEKEKQLSALHEKQSSAEKKLVRVYIDGCFDIMHSGHYNAIRQAKQLGDILVAGVHSDAEILRNKGPTTFNEEERVALVKACKWVDEVVFDVPYSPSIALLDKLNCDFCVHGDDMPTTPEGSSAYHEVLDAGRMKIIKRTEGVSTTDFVGRLLTMTKHHHLPTDNKEKQSVDSGSQLKKISNFLTTTQRLVQFANVKSQIKGSSKIVYIDGSFDLFHVGHVEALTEAKKHGDFLLVGIHDDFTINKYKGENYPIMNLHERVFNVLSCKMVDEVIIGAPWDITKDLIVSMNISLVVEGGRTKIDFTDEKLPDPFLIPKQLGVYKKLDIQVKMTTDVIIQRILGNLKAFELRNSVREKKEQQYIESRKYVEEI
jgi:ethanolamine-phosphate cytidylyltransferase